MLTHIEVGSTGLIDDLGIFGELFEAIMAFPFV